MLLRKVGSVSLMFVMFLLGCKKSPEGAWETIRFIDLLDAGNILSSPFMTQAQEQSKAAFEPLKSVLLVDLGSPANPYNLKKKLDLETEVIDILFSPPRSEYSFDISLPPDAVLEFGTGIVRDSNFETLKESLGKKPEEVRFVVRFQTGGTDSIIFKEECLLPARENRPTHVFSLHRVDLASPAEQARITFQTDGGEGAFSFWQNPIVYSKGRNLQNVILISIDTLRADHLSCYSYQRPTSPNIDALARDSALFEEAYAPSPWTLPSHVSLFTSLPGVSHQVYMIKDRIDPGQTMLAEVLRKHSFFCSAFTGSGYLNSIYGFAQGFDLYGQNKGSISQPDQAEQLFRQASDWLGKNSDKRFFLFLHTYQVHSPYFCPPPYSTMFLEKNAPFEEMNLVNYLGGTSGIFKELPEDERRNIIGLYDGGISYVDAHLIKPLIEKLKELSLYDQTMIIFTSDHGEEFFDHGAWLHSQSLYEEVLKVPLIIKFPGSKYRGTRIKSLVRLIDVMPTILEESGIKTDGLDMAGQSLIPVLRGKEKEDRILLADTAFYSTWFSPKRVTHPLATWFPDKIALGTRKNTLIFNRNLTKEQGSYFSPPPPSLPSVELYDLELDPQEKVNLATQRTDQVALLMRTIKEIYGGKKRVKHYEVKPDENLKEQLRALGYIR